MRAIVSCLLVLATVELAACGTRKDADRSPGSPEVAASQALTVLSYNVNYGLAGDDSGLDALAHSGADLVLLQETNEAWEQAIRADPRVRSRWPELHFHHCCGAGGLALLSRWPVDSFEILEPLDHPDAWFPAARAVVQGPSGAVQLLNVHLRPPVATASEGWVSALRRTPQVRVAEIEHFLPALDPGLPTIVAGDFNEGDGGRALKVLDEAGYDDVVATLPRRDKTWRWGSLRARLDHLLISEHFEVVDLEVLDLGRSDHLPVRAVLTPLRP